MKEEFEEGECYKPGEAVPQTAVYKVYHRTHRLMHEAALVGGTFFPRCKKCGVAVRFVLARAVQAKFVLPFRPTELLEECSEAEAPDQRVKARKESA